MNTSTSYTLITGGTSGIGFELAKVFAEQGHNLILVARDEQELAKTSQQLSTTGVDIISISKDLFDQNAAFDLYDEVKGRGLKVDIIVNNAGQGEYGLFADTDIRRELAIVQLNISSLITITKLFLQDMIHSGEGKILNLSSIASKAPGPWQAVYHGTKAFVQSFSEALRSELKAQNINVTVTALLPGATDTDFFRKAGMESSKMVQDESKLSDPADVAKDGYEALMRGDDKIVSGFKNKMMVAESNMMTDSMAAEMLRKQQEPAKK